MKTASPAAIPKPLVPEDIFFFSGATTAAAAGAAAGATET
jgi:hypothetical protein